MRSTKIVKGRHCIIPGAPGVYRIVDVRSGKPSYVGQTGNLRRRAQQHVRSGLFDPSSHRFAFAPAIEGASRRDLWKTECAHIAKHAPRGNKARGGNGRW